ncbi:hypothetical protein PG997_005959 [Apiospora hydei]|uniref:Heterokaryon incompatibility domain-containing protein n=1 Tax=Apiospora hydei TaxID=1337664 RepID=A0ABR1WMC9_9PEZI
MSHCWGTQMPLRLLSSNIADFQSGIPADQLSRSFQDAIQVLEWLGLSYIWIDSLCIIQDSPEDWEKESALMADVYSNSHCNIAAAHAADGTCGCFAERDPRLVRPLQVEVKLGPNPGVYCGVQESYWKDRVMSAPLNERAWVCQERYLAPRNLSFGETQLYWECCACSASETFPAGLPPGVERMVKSLDPRLGGAALRRQDGLPDVPELDAFALWGGIVHQYSKGDLTFPEDKLVAISGLASRMQKHIQSDYLAGLWRKDLAHQLLWTGEEDILAIPQERPAVYTAPSWSWASRHGQIKSGHVVRHIGNHDIVLEIQDAQTQLVSDEIPFGRVRSGYLRVRGYLARTGVRLQERPRHQGHFSLIVDNKDVGIARVDSYTQEGTTVSHTELHYLPIRYETRLVEIFSGDKTTVHELEGLVCRATSPDPGTEFIRVGWFWTVHQTKEFQALCREYSTGSREVGTTEDTREWGPKLEFTII